MKTYRQPTKEVLSELMARVKEPGGPCLRRDHTRVDMTGEGEGKVLYSYDEEVWIDSEPRLYPIPASDFVNFAKQDFDEGSVRGQINAITSSYRAVQVRTAELLMVHGIFDPNNKKNRQYNWPGQEALLRNLGVDIPKVVDDRVRRLRLQLEHPPLPDSFKLSQLLNSAKDAVEIAELFIRATREELKNVVCWYETRGQSTRCSVLFDIGKQSWMCGYRNDRTGKKWWTILNPRIDGDYTVDEAREFRQVVQEQGGSAALRFEEVNGPHTSERDWNDVVQEQYPYMEQHWDIPPRDSL